MWKISFFLSYFLFVSCTQDKGSQGKSSQDKKGDQPPLGNTSQPATHQSLPSPVPGVKGGDIDRLPLVDETGSPVMFQDFKGRPVVVFFGFTTCQEVCPTAMAYLSQELKLLESLRESIVPVFVTIDPKTDTPEKLAAFVKGFGPDIRAITGTEADIHALSEKIKPLTSYYQVGAASAEHSLAHSQTFFLIDKEGKFTAMLPPPYKKGALADLIAKHLGRHQFGK